jgi:hypothetical protein
MIQPRSSVESPAVQALRVAAPLETLTFLVMASLHLGARVPLGFATLAEPRILPAAIVERVCGLSLALGANGLLARRPWGRPVLAAAHLVAIGGILLGVTALGLGRGPRTLSNDLYHTVMLALLGAGLALLWTREVAAALRDGD